MEGKPPTKRPATQISRAGVAASSKGRQGHILSNLLKVFAVGSGTRSSPNVLQLCVRIYRDVATDADGKMKLMVMVLAFITLCVTRDMLALKHDDEKHDDEKHDDAEMKPGTDVDDEFVPDPPPKWAMTTLLSLCKLTGEVEYELTPDPYAECYPYNKIPVSVIQSIRASHVIILRNQNDKKPGLFLAAKLWASFQRIKGEIKLPDGTAVTEKIVMDYFGGFVPTDDDDAVGAGNAGNVNVFAVATHIMTKHKLNALMASLPHDFVRRFDKHEQRVREVKSCSNLHDL